jgi:hypothetical protein
MTLPQYINCKENLGQCDFYLHVLCKETCKFAQEVLGYGGGATDIGVIKRLDELNEELHNTNGIENDNYTYEKVSKEELND